jgi:hypothetical protein
MAIISDSSDRGPAAITGRNYHPGVHVDNPLLLVLPILSFSKQELFQLRPS